MVSDEADVRAMCHPAMDYCFMFEHYLGWFTVMDRTQDDQVVEEIMKIMTVFYSRFYEMYLRYEERLHFIQQGEIPFQCLTESNDADDYINGSTSANGNERIRQRGRHRYVVSQQHIEGLFLLGFNRREIASTIGVSVDTLRRRRQEFGINIGQEQDSTISNNDLDEIVPAVLTASPHSGERMVMGAVLARDIRVTRARLRSSIYRVDSRALTKKKIHQEETLQCSNSKCFVVRKFIVIHQTDSISSFNVVLFSYR